MAQRGQGKESIVNQISPRQRCRVWNLRCSNANFTIAYTLKNSAGASAASDLEEADASTSSANATNATNSNSNSTSEDPSSSGGSNSSTMVWVPNSGTKYHSTSTCSGMKNPTQVSLQTAISRGYGKCSKCW